MGRVNLAAKAFEAAAKATKTQHVWVGPPRHHLLHQDDQQGEDPEDSEGGKGEWKTQFKILFLPLEYHVQCHERSVSSFSFYLDLILNLGGMLWDHGPLHEHR